MKKILIPSIIIITVALVYYFVLFLPSQKRADTEQQKQAFLFNKQTECNKICNDIHQDNTKSNDKDIITLTHTYAYNENKNACFYSGGSYHISIKTELLYVINCQTNEEVLSYTEIDEKPLTRFCDTCASSESDYKTKKAVFMGK